MQKDMHQLIEELGEAINASLSNSDRFAEVMDEMEKAGYNAYVVLEASIGFRKSDEPEAETSEAEIQVMPQPKHSSEQSTGLTANDLDFLRELKISVA